MSRILVIGDFILDRYGFYETTRTDPANNAVPVIKLLKEHVVPGGAGHLVRNLKSLCSDKEVIFFHSKYFDNLEPAWLHKIGYKPYLRQLPLKDRVYINNVFSYREDKNDIIKDEVEGTCNRVVESLINTITKEDVVVISDYHKGTLTPAAIEKIINKCNEEGALSLIDTNHVFDEHKNSSWLKINLKTASECVDNYNYYLGTSGKLISSNRLSQNISKKNNSSVIITQGATGFLAYLNTIKQNICFTKDNDKKFVDSIGAGDTFLAGFIYSFLNTHNSFTALTYADTVAHLSTHKIGTIDIPCIDEINREFEDSIIEIKKRETAKYVHRTINDD